MSERRYALINKAGVSEINDLSAAVTWANIPDANVPQSAVTQHEAALTILQAQISDANDSNWDTAFGWGNHASLYSLLAHTHTFASLTSKPTTISGYGITDLTALIEANADVVDGKTAFGWGNHASAGYLTAEVDTFATVTARGSITSTALTISTSLSITADGGFILQSAAPSTEWRETDQGVNDQRWRIRAQAGALKLQALSQGGGDVTTAFIIERTAHVIDSFDFQVNVSGPNLNISNWDTAYGWGDHASGGYLTSEVDTFATVTARGSLTATALTLTSGALSVATDAGIIIPTGHPRVEWKETDQPDTDEQRWQLRANAQQFYLTALSSGGGSTSTAFIVTRSGYTIGSFDFQVDVGMANVKYLQWDDAGGTPINLLTFWSDDIFYIGSASHVTVLRGSALTLQGAISANSSIAASGAVTGSNLNVSNWDTAYGWGDHASGGYATSGHNHDATYLGITATAAASQEAQTNATAIDADYKMTFALTLGNTSGKFTVMMDSGSTFYYNPSENTLKLENIEASGALTAATFGGITSANLLDKSATEVVTGQYKFSHSDGLHLEGIFPAVRWYETDASADEGNWRVIASSGQLLHRMYDDAETGNTNWLVVSRSGKTPTTIAFTGALTATSFGGITSSNLLDKSATETVSGAYTFSSNAIFTSSVLSLENAAPRFMLKETDEAADEKVWQTLAFGGQLIHRATSDDLGSSDIWLTISRTGINVDSIAMFAPVTISGDLDVSGAAIAVDNAKYFNGHNSSAGLVGLLTLWSDDKVYVGASTGSHELHLRGAGISLNGNVTATGTINATGAVTGSNLSPSLWDSAYGWGDHAAGGYAALTGATFSGNVTIDGATPLYLSDPDINGWPFRIHHGASGDSGFWYDSSGMNLLIRDDAGSLNARIYGTGNMDVQTLTAAGIITPSAGINMANQYLDSDTYLNLSGGATIGGIRCFEDDQSTLRGYIYYDGTSFGLLNNLGQWTFRAPHGGKKVYISGDIEFEPVDAQMNMTFDITDDTRDVDMVYRIGGTLTAIMRWNSGNNSFTWMDRTPSSVTVMVLDLEARSLQMVGSIEAHDLQLDSSNCELNIKQGTTGTVGLINWTFNTDTTNFISMGLDYDLRATVGFFIDSGYPITLDATTSILFAISGSNKGTWNTTGLTVVNAVKAASFNVAGLAVPHYVTTGYVGDKITVSSSTPGTPTKGDIWFDTT